MGRENDAAFATNRLRTRVIWNCTWGRFTTRSVLPATNAVNDLGWEATWFNTRRGSTKEKNHSPAKVATRDLHKNRVSNVTLAAFICMSQERNSSAPSVERDLPQKTFSPDIYWHIHKFVNILAKHAENDSITKAIWSDTRRWYIPTTEMSETLRAISVENVIEPWRTSRYTRKDTWDYR